MAAPDVDLLPHLRRAHDHIDRHYRAALDLDLLARVAGVSKFPLRPLLRGGVRRDADRYLTRRRIERAQDLDDEAAAFYRRQLEKGQLGASGSPSTTSARRTRS